MAGGRATAWIRDRLQDRLGPQDVDWATLDATWAAGGELDVFDAAWGNDHLTDPNLAHGGSSLEALTMIAALAHHVPGKWVGHTVLSNTFRHPAVLAKAATLLDLATGGRFILGLGAGWHEDEHAAYGIPLPPIGERISRLESAVRVIRALHSPAAATDAGVTLDDPFYPLRGAVNLPGPADAGRSADLARRAETAGPPDGRRARRWLAAAGPAAAGRRVFQGAPDGDPPRDGGHRPRPDRVRVRSPDRDRRGCGQPRPRPRTCDRVRGCRDHPRHPRPVGRLGPDGLRAVAREVAEPLREAPG